MDNPPVGSMCEALDAWKAAHENSGRKDEEHANAKAEKEAQEKAEKEAAAREQADAQARALSEAKAKAREQREAEAFQLMQEAREARQELDRQQSSQALDITRETSMCEALDTWRTESQRCEEEAKAQSEADAKMEQEHFTKKKMEEDVTKGKQHRLRLERANAMKAKAEEDAKKLLEEAKELAQQTQKHRAIEASKADISVSSPSEALDDWNDKAVKNAKALYFCLAD